ncbi:MAG: GntR family transcriptional regulator, partial [Chitinivibrionales bacterium]|nr:GntR family transcriptional regulator [Chitinivibrionales bacterium]MBD3397263.1 GntR family transcriptional regulator [Chitinivibrionales bacterium]
MAIRRHSPKLEKSLRCLRRLVSQTDDPFLPPMDRLAARFHVSVATISKAMRILAEEGLVSAEQGKRTAIRRNMTSSPPPRTAAYRVFTKLKDAIAAGTYRTGRTLPKIMYFVMSEHVSSSTVMHALRLLSDQGLAHKRGKRWIAGPDPLGSSPFARTRLSGAPVILILLPAFAERHRFFFRMGHTAFSTELCNELKRHGCTFRLVCCGGDADTDAFFPTGRKAILHTISSLGKRFAGTVAIGSTKTFDDLPGWAVWLAQFKKPVVFYDADPVALSPNRGQVGRRNYYRCMYG